MQYVSWPSAKRIHLVSLTKSGRSVTLDTATKKLTPRQAKLVTKCGELVPDDHKALTALTKDQHNNELCITCWRTNSF